VKIRVNPWLNLFGAVAAGFLVVFFCLILLWHDPHLFWNDDYELSILPVFADVARSWSHGELPLLSPYSWVCGNLAGEYQYGTFSVFVNAAVVLIWKFPLTFPQQAAALSIAHLFVLAMGGYLLGRGRNLAPPLSLLVAIVAALNGWIVCWGATDWFGALGAFAWLPWAWWGMERALDSRRSKWRFLWPAPFVYLVLTGGFPYTVLMLGLIAAWLVVRSLGQTRRISSIVPLLGGIVLGLGLAAPAWLALLDYVHDSARAVQDAGQHFQWRVPIAALPGFIFPEWTVNWMDFSSRLMPHTATELACGLVPPLALGAALIRFPRLLLRTIGWEIALLIVVLILSMLPTANVFRWSFRWLPLVHLVLVVCAAESLRLFGDRVSPPARLAVSTSSVVVAFVSLLATYLWIPPNCGVPKYNLAQELTQPSPLDPQRLYLSVYPQPEHAYRVEKDAGPLGEVVRPGSTSMWGGVPFINGYSPIRPAGVAREFNFGIHGEIDFAIAKRLMESGDGAEGEMARLGIDGVIVAPEMRLIPPADEWDLVYSTAEGAVYHRRGPPLPRARPAVEIDSRPNERFIEATVSRISDERNRLLAEVTVPANGPPALLIVSRPFFNGYCATIGDVPLKVDSYRGLIPTIEVPAGMSGRFTLVYQPWWLIYGSSLAVLCLSVVAVSSMFALRRKGKPTKKVIA
jgi:hypothetical protein